MKSVVVSVKKLDHFVGQLPSYETLFASGLDVKAQLNQPISLQPLERVMIPTGLSVEIPEGYEIQVRPRSGWAAKKGVTVINSPGTIDADYRGEIKIAVVNLGQETVEILNQDRVAQLVLCPVVKLEWKEVTELTETNRGSGGFGSTGFQDPISMSTQTTP